MKAALRKATCECRAVPVVCGSAYKNKGIQKMIDAVLEYMPSPLDIPAIKGTDLDGNEITEEEFSKHKVTMINFWEPWCGPCVNEMPDLELLYEAYKDKDFQIIGVYSETHMESEVDGILKDKNISYPILKYTAEFDIFQTGYVPTTVFVDSKGHIVKMSDGTDYVIGSNTYEAWESIIKQYL